jgi:rod shape-determining protein MreC
VHTPKSKIPLFLASAFLLTILLLNSKNLANTTRASLTDQAANPLKISGSISDTIKRMIPFASFREENRRLRERISLLTRKLEEARVVYEENERLKEFLSFRKTIPYTTVPAQVIGRDPTNWSNSIIINKGISHGVGPDTAIVSARGLVGKVIEAGRYSSKVMLITDPNSRVGSLITRNRQGGILTGRPDGVCKMIYIALESDVSTGDKVITAGLGRAFPKDIIIGEVVKVYKEPGRLYKYAIVKTAEDLSRLEEVLCIR